MHTYERCTDLRCAHIHAAALLARVYAGVYCCSVDELYSVLELTYTASIGRISQRVELDQRRHADVEQRRPVDALDVAPERQLAELLAQLSSYKDTHSGAAR